MTWGLCTFVVVHVLNFLGLLTDYALYRLDYPTITRFVERNGWLGVPIILIQIVSVFGLLEHFYGFSQ